MKNLLVGLVLVLVFLTGFLSCYAVNSVYIDTEKPFLIGLMNSIEQPTSRINSSDIIILPDKVILNIKNAVLGKYADTGSMLPTLGEDTKGIRIKPESPEQINIGDIITFKSGNILVVHRVVGKGEDEQGFYFVTKGDNNQETDGKVYFQDVEYVIVALVY